MGIEKTKLKGGSLSSTYLVKEGDKKFIRKCVSLTNNREYGYVRWYTQLKKLQRFESDLPGLFPKIINVSYEDDEAYFDLEYLSNHKTLFEILTDESLDLKEVNKIHHAFQNALRAIHKFSYRPNAGAPLLYFKEEVEQKIEDAMKYPEFEKFYNLGTYEHDGHIEHGLTNFLDELRNYFSELKLESEEHIHGNPTLENTMYSFADESIVFIDPYEESIIDTKFLDYSMVLQSSHSHYELLNSATVAYKDNMPFIKVKRLIDPLVYFNKLFHDSIKEEDKKLVDVLHATQFIRMLPFKCASGHISHAKYFYLVACKLLRGAFG